MFIQVAGYLLRVVVHKVVERSTLMAYGQVLPCICHLQRLLFRCYEIMNIIVFVCLTLRTLIGID